MKRYLKKIAVILYAAVMITLFGSCSELPTSGDTPKPQTTITFMSNWGGSSAYSDLVHETIEIFMKLNPGIQVINESLSQEDYLSKLKTNFATGYIPDIFVLGPGYDLNTLIGTGQIASISDIMGDDWIQRYDQQALKAYIRNGHLYSIPFETVYIGLYANSRIFSENGISIPRTYNELVNVIEKLNGDGIIPIAYSSHLEGSLLYQSIVSSLISDVESTKKQPADESQAYIDAMNIMKDLYRLNAFPADCFTLNGYEQNRMFLDGEAAMIVEGSWFSGYLDNMDDPVEITYLPIGENNEEYCIIGKNGYGAFNVSIRALRNESVKDAVIRFLDFFNSRETVLSFIEKKGMISSLYSESSIYENNRYALKIRDLLKNSRIICPFPYDYYGDQVWNDVFVNKFPYMLEERITPEELFKQAMTPKFKK